MKQKYIDIEKLKVLFSDLKENHRHYKGDFHEGVVFAVDELEEDITDSLQQEQPDVDLEKEIERYLLDNAGLFIHADSKTVVQALARYFYELGLKARR